MSLLRTYAWVFLSILAVGLGLSPRASSLLADETSLAFINGKAYRVYYNDGDSFRVMTGEYTGRMARLSGFNTLESFGPAHQWGSFHSYELYTNAKMATMLSRRGVWHCFGDGGVDGYGRLLLECPDLIMHHLSRGLAHVYQAKEIPAKAEYLLAQQEAIRNRRGFWAHGVPDFIVTSIHSGDEDVFDPHSKNRLISTHDGHTEWMEHTTTYDNCSWICNNELRFPEDRIAALTMALRQNVAFAPELGTLSNLSLRELVSRYLRTRGTELTVIMYVEDPARKKAIGDFLDTQLLPTDLQSGRVVQGSCMIHVPFQIRYNPQIRPACLGGHGTNPPNVHFGAHTGASHD